MKKTIGYIVGCICLIVSSPILIIVWLTKYVLESMDEAWGDIRKKINGGYNADRIYL